MICNNIIKRNNLYERERKIKREVVAKCRHNLYIKICVQSQRLFFYLMFAFALF